MFKVYSCLAGDHEFRLVLLALGVCILASSTAVRLLKRLSKRRQRGHLAWLLITACVVGSGVWATHFIGMLAFKPDLRIGYDLGETALSLVLAIALIGGVLNLSLDRTVRHAPAIGGALLGLSVGVMHYVGMAAFHVQGVLLWDRTLATASVVVGAVFGAAALSLARRAGDLKHAVAATTCLTLSICGLHFTGMAAMAVLPDVTVQIPDSTLPRNVMALVVAAVAGLMLLASLATIVIERHQRAGQDRRLRELANAAVEGLVVCDDEIMVTTNTSLERMLGSSNRKLVGRSFTALFEPQEGEAGLNFETDTRREGFMRASGGERIPVEVIIHAMGDKDRQRFGVAVRDLRDREAAQSKIRFLAHYDGLTGLLNRASSTTGWKWSCSGTAARPIASRCCAWTSTASSRSTTCSATARAIRC